MSTTGVPTVAQQEHQCLHSPESQVWSPAWHSGLKDLALLQLLHRSKLQLESDPWPGNSICCVAAKKKKATTAFIIFYRWTLFLFPSSVSTWGSQKVQSPNPYLYASCAVRYHANEFALENLWHFSAIIYIHHHHGPGIFFCTRTVIALLTPTSNLFSR